MKHARHKHSDVISTIVIVLLVFVAGGLVYRANKELSRSSAAFPVPTRVADNEIKRAFSTFTPNIRPTQEEIRAWDTYVRDVAVRTNAIDVSGCSPQPAAVLVAVNTRIMLVNKDRVAHSIGISKTHYAAKPGTSTPISIGFPKGRATYFYSCDKGGMVGAIRVE